MKFKNLILHDNWVDLNQTWNKSYLCTGNSIFFLFLTNEEPFRSQNGHEDFFLSLNQCCGLIIDSFSVSQMSDMANDLEKNPRIVPLSNNLNDNM